MTLLVIRMHRPLHDDRYSDALKIRAGQHGFVNADREQDPNWVWANFYHSEPAQRIYTSEYTPVLSYIEDTGAVRFINGVLIGDIFADVDGFEKFWPHSYGGYWDPHVLRAVADLVDYLNVPWENELEELFATQHEGEPLIGIEERIELITRGEPYAQPQRC